MLATALLWCSSAASAASRAGASSVVRHITLRAQGSAATLTLTLSATVRAHAFRLSRPRRVVIDLPRTRRASPLPPIPRQGLIAGLHIANRSDGGLRLVIALRTAASYHLQWRAGPAAQLRIELTGHAGNVSASTVPITALRAAHAPSGERAVIVAVDPGHGGVDPGATGPHGTHEKDVTLAIARALAARINRTPGMHAVLTRDGDYFVPLLGRIERAQAAHADLFVSIHADSVRDRAISGASVYILSERGASSPAARKLADEENAADLRGGISASSQAPGLNSVLFDLSQHNSIGQSGEAAQDVLQALDSIGDLHKREVQRAAFVVLKSPLVPSMLVETAYISNPTEERQLSNPQDQQSLARAIFRGIATYFRQYPPQGSLFARSGGGAVVPNS